MFLMQNIASDEPPLNENFFRILELITAYTVLYAFRISTSTSAKVSKNIQVLNFIDTQRHSHYF